MTKKKVKFGALPTENMPKKRHEAHKPPARLAREIVKDVPTWIENRNCFTSQLKYVFWLEENVSRAVGQNSLTPLGEQNSLTPMETTP